MIMKIMSLRLEAEQYERLRVLAFLNRKPMSVLVREAINSYLGQSAELDTVIKAATKAWGEAIDRAQHQTTLNEQVIAERAKID